MRVRILHTDVLMDVLTLLHRRLPTGMQPTDTDWNKAYELVYTKAVIETIEWKMNYGIPLYKGGNHAA